VQLKKDSVRARQLMFDADEMDEGVTRALSNQSAQVKAGSLPKTLARRRAGGEV
jgi:hypothetical protein